MAATASLGMSLASKKAIELPILDLTNKLKTTDIIYVFNVVSRGQTNIMCTLYDQDNRKLMSMRLLCRLTPLEYDYQPVQQHDVLGCPWKGGIIAPL